MNMKEVFKHPISVGVITIFVVGTIMLTFYEDIPKQSIVLSNLWFIAGNILGAYKVYYVMKIKEAKHE
jgi:biotin transporter BioY